jgi:uncharacterized damage-inducible protein DinB
MNNLLLVEMLRYNEWANRTLLAACRTLTDEQLDARLDVTSGPTRELLVHLVGAQQTFALRTQGRQHEGELNRESPWPGIETLTTLADETSRELIEIAERLDPQSEVLLPYEGSVYRYPTRFFLVHAIAHGVEHRTEVKLNLAAADVATPDLDGWEYGDAAGYGAEE